MGDKNEQERQKNSRERVMRVQFNAVLKDVTRKGTKIQTDEYLTEGKFPIIDQGNNDIAGYRDDETGLFTDVPAIVFGDHTRIVKYITEPFFLGADGVKVLVPIDRTMNCKYLYYQLLSAKIPDTGYNRHFKWVKELEFQLPSRNEQDDVVKRLDKLCVVISARQQQLAKLDELVKARFVEMFGDMLLNPMAWPEVALETLADIVSGITKGRKVKEQTLLEVPYMAVSNVKDGYIDWTTVKTILATEQEIEQYRLFPDDVLMTEGGDPDKVGRGAIIKEPLENCIHQNHIFRVRLDKEKILPAFFAEYLQHQKSKRYFLGCAKQTTGIASINMKQLKALPVLLPPLDLQQQFDDFARQIERVRCSIQNCLGQMETLKKALIQQYFG